MQVASTIDTASSANIGGGETEEFGLVQDASFLMMLSKNLYTNQNLAPIREILCNAWDIHIEAGKTDTAIEIEITKDLDLVIRDYGFGIPQRDIKKVYGTYGLSTKANNDAVTGGFGLGSKSPFAYVDSFRVISICEGTKTIYNMSAATVNNGGKPGITPIATVATEEPNGITVTFRLQEEDVSEMLDYIKAIVQHGAMKATLKVGSNEAYELPVMELGTEPGSYAIEDPRDGWYYGYMGSHQIYVRYGAVIYPMLDTPGTHRALELLEEFLDLINVKRLVVQAAPGSLTLQPGRETLSSSKMTENGLTDLCVQLVEKLERDIIAQIPDAMNRLEAKLRAYKNLRGQSGKLHSRVDYWGEIDVTPIRLYMRSNLGIQYRAKYDERMQKAEHAGYCATHQFKHNVKATRNWHRIRRMALAGAGYSSYSQRYDHFKKTHILKPMTKVVQDSEGVLKQKNLRIYTGSSYHRYIHDRDLLSHVNDFDDIRHMVVNPIVVVTKRILSICRSLDHCPGMETNKPVWIYSVSGIDRNVDKVIAALETRYKVIDLTVDHAWDPVAMEALEAKKKKAKAKADGTVKARPKNLMASIINFYAHKDQSYSNSMLVATRVTVTTDNPLFFVEPQQVARSGSLGVFGNFHLLSEEEKQRGVMVRNGTELNMAVKRGALPANEYFARKFYETVTDPAFEKYLTKHRQIAVRDQMYIRSGELKLARLMGFSLKDYEKLYYHPVYEKLWEQVKNTGVGNFKDYLTPEECDNYSRIQTLKMTVLKVKEKLDIIDDDPVIGCFGSLSRLYKVIRLNPDRKAAIKSLVSIAIKHGTKRNEDSVN